MNGKRLWQHRAGRAWTEPEAVALNFVRFRPDEQVGDPWRLVAAMLTTCHVTASTWTPPVNVLPINWNHSGSHPVIGARFAAHIASQGGQIDFGDQPDFSGSVNGVPFIGDVGTCGFLAWYRCVIGIWQQKGVWVSVFERSQIIIQPTLATRELFDVTFGKTKLGERF